jgi:hypothetical protein
MPSHCHSSMIHVLIDISYESGQSTQSFIRRVKMNNEEMESVRKLPAEIARKVFGHSAAVSAAISKEPPPGISKRYPEVGEFRLLSQETMSRIVQKCIRELKQ